MYELTPVTPDFSVLEEFIRFIMIGIYVFIAILMVFAVMFGIRLRNILKYSGLIIIIFIISLAVPLTVGVVTSPKPLVPTQKALENVFVSDLSVSKNDQDQTVVSFKTSTYVSTYLEYTDTTYETTLPVIATQGISKKTTHEFILEDVSASGGVAYIIVNGQKYLIDDRPIVITGN